jgi:hypothetical protein
MIDDGESPKTIDVEAPPRSPGVPFHVALPALLRGHMFRRRSWDNEFVFYDNGRQFSRADIAPEGSAVHEILKAHEKLETLGSFHIVHVDEGVVSYWSPSPYEIAEAQDWLPYGREDAQHDALIRQLHAIQRIPQEEDDGHVKRVTLDVLSNQLDVLRVKYNLAQSYESNGEESLSFYLRGDYEGIRVRYLPEVRAYQVIANSDPSGAASFIAPGCDLKGELEEALRQMGRKVEDRQFFHTMLAVDVISEGPIPEGMGLDSILEEMTDGDLVGRARRVTSLPISRADMSAATKMVGSDPHFFCLDEEGNDLDG